MVVVSGIDIQCAACLRCRKSKYNKTTSGKNERKKEDILGMMIVPGINICGKMMYAKILIYKYIYTRQTL